MAGIRKLFDQFLHLLHTHFFWFLIGTYAIAAVAPGFGLWIRGVSFGKLALLGEQTKISLPMVMLSFLLLNAGLGVKVTELVDLYRRPWLLLAGLGANLAVPLAFIVLVSLTMRWWHNPDEVQNILVGLALVASMPIAGSSTAWSQNSNGNLVLSLGLVVGSTILSPLTTPVTLHSVGFLAEGDYAEDLHELAKHGTGVFLVICVIFPSVAGMLIRYLAGEALMAKVKPWLKLVNAVNLLLLSYSNAAIALPEAVAHPDYDLLVIIMVITAGLCVVAFGAGWLIARIGRAETASRTSLTYGLGMNNNGTGLVLASMALADHPNVLLPIIFYNLVQQIVAGLVQFLTYRTSD